MLPDRQLTADLDSVDKFCASLVVRFHDLTGISAIVPTHDAKKLIRHAPELLLHSFPTIIDQAVSTLDEGSGRSSPYLKQ